MADHAIEKDYGHKPVLLQECLDALAIRPDGVYVDGTLGRAGHSLEIVRRLTEGGRLIGIDRDQTAIDAAQERLAPYLDRVTLVHSNFDRVGDILADLHISGVDGMLFDRASPPPSWTTPPGAFPTCTTPRWTCAWTARRPSPPAMW